MNSKWRKVRRKQLDRQLATIQDLHLPEVPVGGWIGSIREALGISLDALGRRLHVSRQTAHEIGRAEQNGSITVKRLRAAAEALGCDLVVLVVPRQPLENMIREQARKVAEQQVLRTSHSMALEQQSLSDERVEQMIAEAAEDLIERGDRHLWD